MVSLFPLPLCEPMWAAINVITATFFVAHTRMEGPKPPNKEYMLEGHKPKARISLRASE